MLPQLQRMYEIVFGPIPAHNVTLAKEPNVVEEAWLAVDSAIEEGDSYSITVSFFRTCEALQPFFAGLAHSSRGVAIASLPKSYFNK
ncbi:hypothetical protein CFB43_22255 [Burkholderia sp. AU15512]|nr:hypothetical protein CFB43_22255 [Burkholderia sp. AU15512]